MITAFQKLQPSRKFFLLHEYLLIALCLYALTHDALLLAVLAIPFVASMISIAVEDTVHVNVIQNDDGASVGQGAVGEGIGQDNK